MNKLLSLALVSLLSITPAFAQRTKAARIQTQTAQASGDIGSAQNLVFQKTRKNVLTAVLKVSNNFQWNYTSITGPTLTGNVPCVYSNTATILSVVSPATASVLIPYGHLMTPSAFALQSYVEITLDPNTLEGVGDLVIPVTTTGSAMYDSLTYTINQTPQYFSSAVLEFTTGR